MARSKCLRIPKYGAEVDVVVHNGRQLKVDEDIVTCAVLFPCGFAIEVEQELLVINSFNEEWRHGVLVQIHYFDQDCQWKICGNTSIF